MKKKNNDWIQQLIQQNLLLKQQLENKAHDYSDLEKRGSYGHPDQESSEV